MLATIHVRIQSPITHLRHGHFVVLILCRHRAHAALGAGYYQPQSGVRRRGEALQIRTKEDLLGGSENAQAADKGKMMANA